MISIIIADDEKLIRAGIKKILTESFEVPLEFYEAKNGSEAFELCKANVIDILITDIRMPVMDGVELMNKLSTCDDENFRKPYIIVLSGFDDFTYAKAAIKNGAVSYILKPVDKKELVDSVKKAAENVYREEQIKNEQALQKISETGIIDSTIEINNSEYQNGVYCAVITGANCAQSKYAFLKGSKFYKIEQKKNMLCIVFPANELENIEKTEMPACCSMGVSLETDSLSMLRTVRDQAFVAMLQSFFNTDLFDDPNAVRGSGVFHFIQSEKDIDFSSFDSDYSHCVEKISIASTEELVGAMHNLLDFTNVSEGERAILLDYLYGKFTTDLFSRFQSYTNGDSYLYLKSLMIENIQICKNLFEWIQFVCDYVVYLSAVIKNNTTKYPFIDEALEYIKKHFTKNINMAMVANQVSVNYTWFSEKFKEHTGMNFNDYLKQLRLEEAERLLRDTPYKVYEVSSHSGFGDVKYFMKTFRETTGLTPSEWRRKYSK